MTPPTSPKVSIILPVYNAGEHLHQCLQSLIGQTLKEIEIIAVLDCPTDGSDRVVREYAARDPRIHVIENEQNLNIGLSRNRGIEAARGEYIGFCDHDDYAKPDLYEQLYLTCREYEADIAICNVGYLYTPSGQCQFIAQPSGHGAVLKDTLLRRALRVQPYSATLTIWNLLFSRQFINRQRLRFHDNRHITSEDGLFLITAYLGTDQVAHCPSPAALYTHVLWSGNTGQTYAYRNLAHTANYATALHHVLTLHDSALQHAYRLDTAEGIVRLLYTAFRHEMRFKGFRYALRQACLAGHNEAVHRLIAPYRSWSGAKHACRILPPTKLAFACLLHLAHLTGKRQKHQTTE